MQDFKSAVSSGDAAAVKGTLKSLYTLLMSTDESSVQQLTAALAERLAAKPDRSAADELALRLYAQYPGDVGLFSVYFLNQLTLQPGQAFFMGPNRPHAYIRGDCLEVMATSDNVVRAGLTPKYKDVDTLTTMLTYEMLSPQARTSGAAHRLALACCMVWRGTAAASCHWAAIGGGGTAACASIEPASSGQLLSWLVVRRRQASVGCKRNGLTCDTADRAEGDFGAHTRVLPARWGHLQ